MSNFLCIRGGKILEEDEFKSHLLLASKVENLGVFLGAGASKVAGGQLVREVWETFLLQYSESAEWLKDQRFIQIKDELAIEEVDIEATLDALTIAELEWKRKSPTGATVKDLEEHRNNLYRCIIKAAWLNDDLWKYPFKRSESASLREHKLLLVRLLATRQPGQSAPTIFTVNYDLAVEWAAEALSIQVTNGFSGFHLRTFAPQSFDLAYRNVQAKGEARFGTYHLNLVKLHGSLTWLSNNDLVQEICSDQVKKKGTNFLTKPEQKWPGLVVMPTGAKYLQTVGYLFGELNRKFSEFLARTHACLIVNGYSFVDDHINKIILAALQNPTLHLILYVPELPAWDSKVSMDDWIKTINNRWLRAIVSSQLPQVTVIGCSSRAYFSELVRDLPVPALYDEHEQRIQRLRELFEANTATTIRLDV